jgi:hypothetical protein
MMMTSSASFTLHSLIEVPRRPLILLLAKHVAGEGGGYKFLT